MRITTVALSLDKLLEGQPRFMAEKGMEVCMVSDHSPSVERLIKREGCPHYTVPMTRTISPLKDLVSLFKLMKLMRKWKPDIVHTHTPKAGIIGMLAAKLTGVPVRMHTVAGLPLMEASGVKRAVLEAVEKLTYLCANKVYPNSNVLKQFIREKGLAREEKLKVIGKGSSNGINTHFFELTPTLTDKAAAFRKVHNISEDQLVFIFIGRIVRDKGINELVSAFVRLHLRYPQARLLLLGPFEDDLDPVDEAVKNQIVSNPAIIHTGYQDDVRPFISAADVLVFPSYREGFPNVPMQAACLHLPCIVTDINGCNEIIEEGVNGLMIPVKDEKALYQAMERMLTDDGLRSACAAVAREMITTRFSRETVWNALLEEYNTLLGIRLKNKVYEKSY